MRISREMVEELVAHAREKAPNECCGMIGGTDGRAVSVHPVTNAEASPLRYRMDPQEQLDTMNAIEAAGQELLAIYHSHTKSAAYPSQTDVNEAEWWPDQVYVIVSLQDPDGPQVRGFRIRDGKIDESELELD
jgi:proteasome lid subunit RPN8/RPN11